MPKKLLICGATGFIGRNLLESFAQDERYEVTAVHFKRDPYAIENVRWVRGDLRNADDVSRIVEGQDIVVQAAATTSGSKDIVSTPHIHVTDNALMNSLVLRACYDFEVEHMVFFSCSIMYASSDRPVLEDSFDPTVPLNPRYFGAGWTKLYIEKMCEFFAGLGETRHTVIRHSNIYGPWDKYDLEHSHVCGATITKVMTAPDYGTIKVWGEGKEARDLLYVDDLIDFVHTAIEQQKTPYELLNVGLGEAITINELVDTIISLSGKNLNKEHDLSQPTIPTSLSLDCSRAKKLFGWSPQYTLRQGLGKTLAWYREHKL